MVIYEVGKSSGNNGLQMLSYTKAWSHQTCVFSASLIRRHFRPRTIFIGFKSPFSLLPSVRVGLCVLGSPPLFPGREMASFCRSAIMTGSRSLAARSKALAQKTLNRKPLSSHFPSPTMRAISNASRVVSVLGSVDSLMPFHSATANARLKSSIAVDSSCWSWLSQGLATPL